MQLKLNFKKTQLSATLKMSNEAYEKLCKKHNLNGDAKTDFKNFFEKEIIKVFNKKSTENGKESIIKKITKEKSSSNSDGICNGKKADGKPCTFKAKPDSSYCGRHDPDKTTKTNSSSKPRVKKQEYECHAVIPKTGKKCIQKASIKPDGSDFYYCKRHSEKWIDFEKEPEQELISSEEEEENCEENCEEENCKEENCEENCEKETEKTDDEN